MRTGSQRKRHAYEEHMKDELRRRSRDRVTVDASVRAFKHLSSAHSRTAGRIHTQHCLSSTALHIPLRQPGCEVFLTPRLQSCRGIDLQDLDKDNILVCSALELQQGPSGQNTGLGIHKMFCCCTKLSCIVSHTCWTSWIELGCSCNPFTPLKTINIQNIPFFFIIKALNSSRC